MFVGYLALKSGPREVRQGRLRSAGRAKNVPDSPVGCRTGGPQAF
jgi:hypothetical protein